MRRLISVVLSSVRSRWLGCGGSSSAGFTASTSTEPSTAAFTSAFKMQKAELTVARKSRRSVP